MSEKKCTTHHHACDCREAKFRGLEEENERLKRDTVGPYTHGEWKRAAQKNFQKVQELREENERLKKEIEIYKNGASEDDKAIKFHAKKADGFAQEMLDKAFDRDDALAMADTIAKEALSRLTNDEQKAVLDKASKLMEALK